MAHKDWVPGREQDLIDLCRKWKAVLENSVMVLDYGWDNAAITPILGLISGFLDAREAYEANDSSAKRLIKDEAKKKCIDGMRDFANSSVRFNKKMNDAAKMQLGIFPRDTAMTHNPAPTVRPDIVVENTSNHFEHRIRAIDSENGKASKPEGVHGVRYGWQVGGEKPASGEDLPKSKFNRKTNQTITYTEADKGKTAYYSVCYENSAGDQGLWSPIEEAIIG
ncbi:MAG: hypothetical protein LBK00_02610 [Treponema sp.]|jgi:hypothetical protein|nr:hypothetical protein [Treponema sp.]